ncbi:flagellar basal body-associated FliL family protein [Sulfitobacter sp. S190]|uniref:flagellar basal body-associated FliL family protein n=1 Tax=Sulfitobacter sp. S190 TaxID=2867022 RepID=UPI0021A79383|nr:flagellar basal body-associated FliL family protein [Sulfitobacter sp. S190]UWR22368.1 flagellar basal body-associated FliL family protein [Sulfitobacter sp. S190]
MKKILPVILLLLGSAAGVGAGIYLRPAAPEATAADVSGSEEKTHTGEDHATGDDHTADAPNDGAVEYVKLENQFVVPIVDSQRVNALVILSLSVEVPAGGKEIIYEKQPKLRDSFLQILFDHANVGGFDGSFTNAVTLGRLRTALKEIAQRDLGKEAVSDILIIEIARQDY